MTDATDGGTHIIREVGRRVATPGGWVIAPVLATFPEGANKTARSESLDRYLKAHGQRPLPSGVDEFFGHYDAVWARGRLPMIFEYAPMHYVWGDPRFSFLDEAFVARATDMTDHVLVCTDKNLRVQLIFDPGRTDTGSRELIAAAFWELLLADPNDLADYDDYFVSEDDGSGALICNAVCQNGRFSVDSVADLDA